MLVHRNTAQESDVFLRREPKKQIWLFQRLHHLAPCLASSMSMTSRQCLVAGHCQQAMFERACARFMKSHKQPQ